NIKETRLLHIAIPSINAEEIESYRRPQNQGVFRTLQMMDGFCRPVPGFAKSKLKQHQKGGGPVKDDRRPVVAQGVGNVRR
ncbi:hypothetical protein, partial [Acetobacter estunensis]|uniref:hypothetical protein n=1 Tax=Acetobacter estunensis TaxID=104097 RepID=UPI001A7EEC27